MVCPPSSVPVVKVSGGGGGFLGARAPLPGAGAALMGLLTPPAGGGGLPLLRLPLLCFAPMYPNRPLQQVVEQALWCLGNIAGDSVESRCVAPACNHTACCVMLACGRSVRVSPSATTCCTTASSRPCW